MSTTTGLGGGPCLPNAHAAGVTVVLGACDEEPGLTYTLLAQALDAVVATASDEVLRAHVAGRGGELVRPGLAAAAARGVRRLARDPRLRRFRPCPTSVGLMGPPLSV